MKEETWKKEMEGLVDGIIPCRSFSKRVPKGSSFSLLRHMRGHSGFLTGTNHGWYLRARLNYVDVDLAVLADFVTDVLHG